MALMTGEEYIERIRKINMEVYMFWQEGRQPGGRSNPPPVAQLGPHDV